MMSYRHIWRLLLFCFIISLVWCGDADCLSGEGNNNCASIVCSLMGKHDDQGTSTEQEDAPDCTCVCHLPSIPSNPLDFTIELTAERSSIHLLPFALETPAATPFRPPIAA
jgi:hypothetical protein